MLYHLYNQVRLLRSTSEPPMGLRMAALPPWVISTLHHGTYATELPAQHPPRSHMGAQLWPQATRTPWATLATL